MHYWRQPKHNTSSARFSANARHSRPYDDEGPLHCGHFRDRCDRLLPTLLANPSYQTDWEHAKRVSTQKVRRFGLSYLWTGTLLLLPALPFSVSGPQNEAPHGHPWAPSGRYLFRSL